MLPLLDSLYVPNPTTISFTLATGLGALFGWHLAETTGSATAAVELLDGQATGQPFLTVVNLAANESVRDYLPRPKAIERGVFLRVVSGSVKGCIDWLPGERWAEWGTMLFSASET